MGGLGSRGVSARRARAMIALLTALPVLALAAQAPQEVDSIRALASNGPDSVLVERVRQRNDAARKAAVRGGADVALRAWRESLRRYEALADTAGIASVLTAIGAGFHYAQQSDSAEAYLTLAHGYAERVGDYRMLGNVWSLLGIA